MTLPVARDSDDTWRPGLMSQPYTAARVTFSSALVTLIEEVKYHLNDMKSAVAVP